MEYNFKEIEAKWQRRWQEEETYRVEADPTRPKFYVLDMFPYPSGAGLHVGHPLGYIASDIYSRYKRLCGFNVLHPMGYDAFGLPAEQYAIQTGQHPAVTTERNIARYREQLDKIGFSFDWHREVRTCDPSYYKWTQWAFLEMFKHYYDRSTDKAEPIEKLVARFEAQGTEGLDAACTQEMRFTADEWKSKTEEEREQILQNYRLAFRADTMVNWCPQLGTVLANDEVKDGLSERGGFPVEQKRMKQWLLRVTAYAQRMLDGLERLEWSDSLKEIQRNWIGRSEGAQVFFDIKDSARKLEIFTTRPDTIFGVTFMVIAPEHEWVGELTTPDNKAAVEEYICQAKKRSERERIAETKRVSGVATGSYAINPFTGKAIPIYISDYVLAGYGTGAIMAVPAHDSRDYAFARHFGLEIVPVVEGGDISQESYDAKSGKVINSDFLDGKDVKEAIGIMFDQIEQRGLGRKRINYRLRDAIFSRQRYWGEPVPCVYTQDGKIYFVPDEELPVVLPELEDYKGKNGQAPLENATEWKKYDAHGIHGTRETSTMPGSAGSSWYYMRYIDPKNDKEFCNQELLKHWMPVDLYVGGPEHAVGHLMYSRIWNRFLYDQGLSPVKEPFQKLVHQGMILGENGIKMGKRFPEFVVNPSDVVREYGADTLRLYEMFMGPLEVSKPWSTTGVVGAKKFINRVWNFFTEEKNITDTDDGKLTKIYHQTVKKVTSDFEALGFNTAIAQMMVFVNEVYKNGTCPREYAEGFIKMISCIIPHVGEELWQLLGHSETIAYEPWPTYDESKCKDQEVTMAVQVNGKMRGTVLMEADLDNDTVVKNALADEKIAKFLEKIGGSLVKTIVVKNKLVNLIVK